MNVDGIVTWDSWVDDMADTGIAATCCEMPFCDIWKQGRLDVTKRFHMLAPYVASLLKLRYVQNAVFRLEVEGAKFGVHL